MIRRLAFTVTFAVVAGSGCVKGDPAVARIENAKREAYAVAWLKAEQMYGVKLDEDYSRMKVSYSGEVATVTGTGTKTPSDGRPFPVKWKAVIEKHPEGGWRHHLAEIRGDAYSGE